MFYFKYLRKTYTISIQSIKNINFSAININDYHEYLYIFNLIKTLLVKR